ncbi:FAD-dependent oxidoreductase [Streptomyces sp. WMMC905]|uniref:FAD-dependent oxidoreductase n=1 Tax=Streptomyces sp. WMMC905 TaxID=3404123 RepID=UPI003B957936
MTEPSPTAVVLGGSLAGLLAARALAPFVDRVTVLERDRLPEGPRPRRGLPQARHAHQLWSGGGRALEELLPGVTTWLRRHGAHRQAVTADIAMLSPQGWYRRWPESHSMLLCTRDLLDHAVRTRVLAEERVTLVEEAEAVGLIGDATAVTGVRVRERDGRERALKAGLVVDATGRGSRMVGWLAELGAPAPRERVVDAGLCYASRLYRAPEAARGGFPLVSVQADPRSGGPGRGGVLLPVEDGRWLVTLFGTRGGEPPSSGEDFVAFAREGLRHPVIGDLIARAEPLGEVSVSRTTANRRRFYERLARRPENVVVLGDALAALNPVYGHGMAVAARGAVGLRSVLRRRGFGAPGIARAAQRAVARPAGAAWDLAVGQDVFFPGATPDGPSRRERITAAYVDRLVRTATGNGRVARRLTDVMSLERRAEVLVSPGVLSAAVVGPLRPAPTGPPLTRAERRAAGLDDGPS